MKEKSSTTRSVQLSTSLHFQSLLQFKAAGSGTPQRGQTATDVDNGYGLQGNPTHHQLQDAISKLEAGTHTLLYPSGLSALTALETFVSSGDHWVLPDCVYGPARRYANYLKEKYSVEYSLYDATDLSTLERAIRPNTKLIHIESPGSITFEVTNIDEVVKIAKSRNILTSADNTWASGVLYQPLKHDVDISILGLTKYPAGYSDVFMGSVTTKNKTLFKKLSFHHRVHGYTVSPVSAMLVERGLESLKVRLAAQAANIKPLINTLKKSKKIQNFYHVDSEKQKDFSGTNSLFTIELDRTYADHELEKLFSTLQTFKIGESWGGTRSLVLPFQPDELSGRFNPPKNTLVRFHSGLEDLELQIQDITLFRRVLDTFN